MVLFISGVMMDSHCVAAMRSSWSQSSSFLLRQLVPLNQNLGNHLILVVAGMVQWHFPVVLDPFVEEGVVEVLVISVLGAPGLDLVV